MALSDASCIVGQKGNERAQVALSSLIHALYEKELLVLARLVTKQDKPPVLVMLAPSIEQDIECLVDVQVPFAEDIRQYTFAPLDKVVTMKGKVLTKHRNLPTEEQDEAMSDYVDSMNLMTFSHDEKGYHLNGLIVADARGRNAAEYLRAEDTYSPLLHRINQVIGFRAVHPDDPLPPPMDVLTKYSHPPPELVKGPEKVAKNLIETFNTKKGTSRSHPRSYRIVSANALECRRKNLRSGRGWMRLNLFRDSTLKLFLRKELLRRILNGRGWRGRLDLRIPPRTLNPSSRMKRIPGRMVLPQMGSSDGFCPGVDGSI
jgi:hypothetical protein